MRQTELNGIAVSNNHGNYDSNQYFPRLLSPRLSNAASAGLLARGHPRRHSFLLSGSADLNENAARTRSISHCLGGNQLSVDDWMAEVDSPRASAMVDNEEEEAGFFEGVEKLLEVWFKKEGLGFISSSSDDGSSDDEDPYRGCDLRKIPRERLDRMLDHAKCEIISSTHNAQLDAYVLSESSMFISQRRFILKTCGTTTPLECLPTLMKLVEAYTGFDTIENIFYSRKNFARPDLQLTPHRSFEREVAILDDMFADGAAYCMGTLNRDCWYLYTLNSVDKFVAGNLDREPDQTVEILMQDLDPEVMAKFTKERASNAKEATAISGIDKILPNIVIDDFLFEPCGYSMNGILNNEAADTGLGEYMTIHITPEKAFSYVSFETNVPMSTYLDMIRRVLDTFLPGKFVLTIFANKTSCAAESHKELQGTSSLKNWVRKDIQYSQFQNYELTYVHFVRFPS